MRRREEGRRERRLCKCQLPLEVEVELPVKIEFGPHRTHRSRMVTG